MDRISLLFDLPDDYCDLHEVELTPVHRFDRPERGSYKVFCQKERSLLLRLHRNSDAIALRDVNQDQVLQ